MNSPHPRWHQGLLLSQVLAMLLMVFSYARILGDARSMAFHSKVLDSLYGGPIWGTTLGNNLLMFGVGVLLLHMMYGAACWGLGRASVTAWPRLDATPRQHVVLWFVLVTGGVLAFNAANYTMSSLGEPYAESMSRRLFGIKRGDLVWYSVVVAAATTLIVAFLREARGIPRIAIRGAWTLGALTLACLSLAALHFIPRQAATASAQPNVILIGLDSLRDDLVDERTSPGVTPNVTAFVSGATRFSNAITPLARTFPSMLALLTGRHPHRSGAVMNLLPRHMIDDRESLPRILARAGYHTVYATDEVRFANIDHSYGFAQTITPPIGASEFMIEKIADAPVTNLLVNTLLGRLLFPHVHANRGSANTYDPDAFVQRIERELRPEKPLFLTAHLTLVHWPYTWAGAPVKRKSGELRWPPYYLNAARRVDEQFGDLMASLENKGLLENAIVVVYSDHGESFNDSDESLVPDDDPVLQALGIRTIWGHGTSVLATNQYQILMSLRRYGMPWPPGRAVRSPVSFEDVAPTIVDALGLENSARFDGRSLLPLLENREGAEQLFAGRIRFTETEYQMPAGMATQDGTVSPSKLREALAVYQLDRDTDRITVKQSHLDHLLDSRQYAAIGDSFLLAAFPRREEPGFDYVAVTLDGGGARQLKQPPPSEETELHRLWDALHHEFSGVLLQLPDPVANSTVADRDQTFPRSVTK